MSKMNVLFVAYTPAQKPYTGASIRTNKVWRALCEVADVHTVVLLNDPAAAEPFLEPGSQDRELARIHYRHSDIPWPGTDAKLAALIDQATSGMRFDLMVARHLRVAMVLQRCRPAPIVLDADDLSKVVPASRFWQGIKIRVRQLFKWALTKSQIDRYAHVWYVNPADIDKFPVRRGSLLPNVVDLPAPVDTPPNPQPTLLMVGTYSYQPNVDGARFFVREVWPSIRAARPDAVLRLVGGCPDPLRREWETAAGVQVCGYVDDLAAEYARATAVIAPVFSGGGTQIKVLEGLAYGCGMVASSFTLAGFPQMQAGTHALRADAPDEWTTQCLRLFDDRGLARRLGEQGRQLVRAHYSYEGMSSEVARTLRSLEVARA